MEFIVQKSVWDVRSAGFGVSWYMCFSTNRYTFNPRKITLSYCNVKRDVLFHVLSNIVIIFLVFIFVSHRIVNIFKYFWLVYNAKCNWKNILIELGNKITWNILKTVILCFFIVFVFRAIINECNRFLYIYSVMYINTVYWYRDLGSIMVDCGNNIIMIWV